MQKVLVTGGAGFIGSELTHQLASKGIHVIVVDNLVNGKKENLADVSAERLQLEVADIRDEERMDKLLRGVDAVFHLACMGVRHSIHSPRENHSVNAEGTLKLLLAAKRADVERFVYVSSSEVYGTARWVPMTEEHPTFPMTVYGASKLAGDCYARAFFETYSFPTVVVRPFNSYGPRCHHEGDSGEVIPKFMLRSMAGRPMIVFGDGSQTRDFTHVSDTARGIILAGTVDAAVGKTINLGSGTESSIKDIAFAIKQVVGAEKTEICMEDSRPGDVLRLCADASQAKKLLGFEPSIPLEQGLISLKNWYLSLGKTADSLLDSELVYNWNV